MLSSLILFYDMVYSQKKKIKNIEFLWFVFLSLKRVEITKNDRVK